MAESVFRLPDLGEGLLTATVLEWRVSEGDSVKRNTPLAEVETSKSAVEIPSPHEGRVARRHVDEGAELEVGDPLVTFELTEEPAGIVGTVPEEPTTSRRVRLTPPEE